MKLKFIGLTLRALLDWPSSMPQALGAHPHIGTRTQLVEKDGAAVRAYVRQNRVLDLLTTIPDPDLVCAYELDQLYRRAARQADTTRSKA
jgi:hypothetical protein